MKKFVLLLMLLGALLTSMAQDITSGLVLYMPFDRDFEDHSSNGYHFSAPHSSFGNLPSYTKDRNNRIYNAGTFGGGECLEIPNANALNSNFNVTDYTLAMWVKTTATRNQWIWVKGYSGTRYQINMNASGAFSITYVGAVNENLSSSAGYNDGNWHFVVWRRSGTTSTIYVDGVADGSATGTITSNSTGNETTTIGRYPTAFTDYFLGQMDEIRFYNRALTDQDIEAIRTLAPEPLPTNPITDGLAIKYDFNGNANDEGVNGYHGTVAGPTLTTDRFNIPNSAYSFGGKITSTYGYPSADELTVSVWFSPSVNFNASTQTDVIYEKTSHYQIYYHLGRLSMNGTSVTMDFAANTWHHVVGVQRVNGQIDWYIDNVNYPGAISGAVPTAATLASIGNSPLAQYAGNLFHGKIDDLRIWGRALRPDEVDVLYNEVKTNQPPFKNSVVTEFTIAEDAGLVSIVDLNTMYTDPEGTVLNFTVGNSNPNVTVQKTAANVLQVQAAADYSGVDNITINYSDGVTSYDDDLTLTITPVNDVPTFTLTDSYAAVRYDLNGSQVVTSVASVSQPADESGQTVTYSISPTSVDFATINFDSNTGELSVDAVAGYSDSQLFTITANDGQAENNTYSQDFLLTLHAIELEDALLSHFSFDGNKWDLTGNISDLTDPIAPTLIEADHHGQPNGAYSFSESRYSRISTFNNIPLEDGFSVATWIKPTTEMNGSSVQRTIYEHRGNTSIFYYEAGELRLELNTTKTRYAYPVVLSAGIWYHLAVTVNINGKVIFYIDNVAHEIGPAPASLNQATSFLYVGAYNNPGIQQPGAFLNGAIDDLRFFGRAINPLEVEELYTMPEYVLQSKNGSICDGASFITPQGTEFTTAGKYTYLKPASIDTLVYLTLGLANLPSVAANATSLSICEGQPVTLTGAGADSYTWDNDVENGVPFYPTVTTTYTATGLNATTGCSNTAQIQVEVSGNPVVDESLTADDTELCSVGSSTTVTTSGSESGLFYFLRNNATGEVLDGPITGDGNPIEFNTGALNADIELNVLGSESDIPPSAAGGGALDFDGTNDKINIPYNSSMALSTAFTIEGWIYPKATTYTRVFTNFSGSSNTPGDILLDLVGASVQNGRGLRLYMTKANGTGVGFSVDNVVTLNTWNHVAATFDNGTIKLFVNGLEVKSDAFGQATLSANTQAWTLGEDRGGTVGEFFFGKMDEIRVWNVAKAGTDLLASKDDCLAGNEAGLVAYYKFDDGAGSTTIQDYSTNNNTGTLLNMDSATDWVTGHIDCVTGCSRVMSDIVSITVGDSEAPVATAQDITVTIGADGQITVLGSEVNDGSTDNCTADEALTFSLDKSTFTCEDVGENTVTLTVTDESGNSATTTATITVNNYIEDMAITAPAELCENESAAVTLAGSVVGANYYLKNASGTIVDGPKAGTGQALEFNSLPMTASETYSVYGEIPGIQEGVHAVTLDGQNDYIDLGTDNRGITNQLSISVWIKTTSTQARPIIAKLNAVHSYYLWMTNTGEVYTQLYKATGAGVTGYNITTTTTTRVNDGEWHMVTLAVNSTNVLIFIDDQLAAAKALNQPNGVTLSNNSGLIIGAYPAQNQYAQFEIDQCAIWNTGFTTTAEVAALYNDRCLSGSEANLSGLFKFDGTDNTVVDYSPSALNGQLVNMDPATDYITGISPTCGVAGCGVAMSQTVIVNVIDDQTAPVVITQNISVSLDGDGNASISAEQVNNGSNDNCTANENLILSLDKTAFTCADQGDNMVTLTVTDAKGNEATATATVSVVDDLAPIVLVENITVQLDVNGTATIAAADIDNGSSDACGAVTLVIDITTFDESKLGVQIVTLTATDAAGNSASAGAEVTVVPYNQSPVIELPIDNFSFFEDAAAITIVTDLDATFSDPEDDALTYSVSSADPLLIAQIVKTAGVSSVVVTATADFFGVVNVTVSATDQITATDMVIAVTVEPVNDQPIFTLSGDVNVTEDFDGTISVTATQLQPANESAQTLTYSISPATVGFANVSIDANTGKVDVSAVANGFGSQIFTVAVNDGELANNSYSTSFTLTVTAVDDAPVLVSAIQDATGDEDLFESTLDLSSFFTEVDGEILTYSVNELSGTGLLNIQMNGAQLSLTTNTNQFGSAMLEVVAADPQNNTASSTFTVNVNAVNDAPTFIVSGNISAPKNFTDTKSVTVTADAVPFGEENQPVIYTLSPASVTFANVAINSSTGEVTITAIADEVGTQEFTITANDGEASNNLVTQTFTLSVLNNLAPVVSNPIADMSLNEDESGTLVSSISSVFSDPENDALTFTASHDFGANVTVVISGNTIQATPAANYFGTGTITVTAADANQSVSDSFVLTITSVNDAPSLVNIIAAQTATEDVPYSFTIPANTFSDVDGDNLTISVSGLPGWLSFDAQSQTLSGTPTNDNVGSFVLIVSATDNEVSTSQSVNFTVENVNDYPVIISQPSLTFDEDGAAQSIDLTTLFSDADGDVLSFTIEAPKSESPAILTATINENTLTVTPLVNANGAVNLVIIASDGHSEGGVSYTLPVTIHAVNDAPEFELTATALTLEQDFTGTQLIEFALINVPENEAEQTVTFTVTPATSNVVAVSINEGSLSLTAIAGASGTATFTLTANDGQEANASFSATFTVTIVKALGLEPTFVLRIYPNPVADVLTVESNEALKVNIFDLEGSEVTHGVSNQPINIYGLPSGIYLIKCVDEKGKTLTRKIVKAK